jgi:deoxyribonuclease (pyrimidine dimer)
VEGAVNVTRINVVPVEELCDQHLLAEHRELKRIPNCLLKGILAPSYDNAPTQYTLGAGHIKFFVDKLGWLWQRYNLLHAECLARDFNVSYQFRNMELEAHGFKLKGWTPTDAALELNRARIKEKMPKKPRFTPHVA